MQLILIWFRNFSVKCAAKLFHPNRAKTYFPSLLEENNESTTHFPPPIPPLFLFPSTSSPRPDTLFSWHSTESVAKKIQANLDGVAACSHLGILSVIEENEGGGVKKKKKKKERREESLLSARQQRWGNKEYREMRFAFEIINFDLCSVSGFTDELDL